MFATKTPYLHCRNGIYYYRNQSTWKSLRTRCKKEAFRKLSLTMFGTTPAVNDIKLTAGETPVTPSNTKLAPNDIPSTSKLIKDCLAESCNRWCARKYTRIETSLGFLPKEIITKKIAIELKLLF